MDARVSALDEASLAAELGWVRALARGLVADPNDADDLAQEAWLRARTAPPERFAGAATLRAWLAAVTRRLARDGRRSRRRRAERERRTARAEAEAVDVVERSARAEALVHAVRALDEPYRTAVLLRYLDGLPSAVLAERTGVSEVAVRKRLSRGLERLRATLEREWGTDFRAVLVLLAEGAAPGAGHALLGGSLAVVAVAAALIVVRVGFGAEGGDVPADGQRSAAALGSTLAVPAESIADEAGGTPASPVSDGREAVDVELAPRAAPATLAPAEAQRLRTFEVAEGQGKREERALEIELVPRAPRE